jgi:hypothetical protein
LFHLFNLFTFVPLVRYTPTLLLFRSLVRWSCHVRHPWSAVSLLQKIHS